MDTKGVLDIFKIPTELKHDHNFEVLSELNKGIETIKAIGGAGDKHSKCFETIISYSELNIRLLLVSNIFVPDKKIRKEIFDLYVSNIKNLFFKE